MGGLLEEHLRALDDVAPHGACGTTGRPATRAAGTDSCASGGIVITCAPPARASACARWFCAGPRAPVCSVCACYKGYPPTPTTHPHPPHGAGAAHHDADGADGGPSRPPRQTPPRVLRRPVVYEHRPLQLATRPSVHGRPPSCPGTAPAQAGSGLPAGTGCLHRTGPHSTGRALAGTPAAHDMRQQHTAQGIGTGDQQRGSRRGCCPGTAPARARHAAHQTGGRCAAGTRPCQCAGTRRLPSQPWRGWAWGVLGSVPGPLAWAGMRRFCTCSTAPPSSHSTPAPPHTHTRPTPADSGSPIPAIQHQLRPSCHAARPRNTPTDGREGEKESERASAHASER